MSENKFVLVTCIFDIKSKRKIEAYISMFNWIKSLNIPTIVYTNVHIANDNDNIHINNMKIEDIPNIKLINKIGKDNINKIKNYNYPVSPEYYGIITSKTFLLQKSLLYIEENIPQLKNKHLVWLDSGIAHVGTISKNRFISGINKLLSDKINLTMMQATSDTELKDIVKFLNFNYSKIAAGLIIIPWNLVEWLHDEMSDWYNKSLSEYKQYVLEEQLLPIIANKNKDKFKYIYSSYTVLYNLEYINYDIHVVINNLNHCMLNNIRDIGMDILYSLLKSIKGSKVYVTNKNICDIFINGFIISYYVNRSLSKNIGRLINYLYHYNSECKKIFEADIHIENNLKFVDIDIKNNPGEQILEEDIAEYIWIIL